MVKYNKIITASKYSTYCFTVANNILQNFHDSDEADNLLNYYMHFVQFYPDEEGRLSLIINDNLSCADKLGDYPIITPQETRDSLLNGNYITSVPYEIEDDGSLN